MSDAVYDIAVVGCGPIGLELAILAKQAGLSVVAFDSGPLAATLQSYPDATELFSHGDRLAIAGIPFLTATQQRPTREQYLAYLINAVGTAGLKPRLFEAVIDLKKSDEGIELTTCKTDGRSPADVSQVPDSARRLTKARFVALATGNLNDPNLLYIPGEDLPHVTHDLGDPFRFAGQNCVVVGGRHSALTASLRLARLGCEVTVSYWSPQIHKGPTHPLMYKEFHDMIREGQITFLPSTQPVEITQNSVVLEHMETQERSELSDIDAVVVQTGFWQDKRLFEAGGVSLGGEQESPSYLADTMETDVAGIFVAGTCAVGDSINFQRGIDATHAHCPPIIETILGRLRAEGSKTAAE